MAIVQNPVTGRSRKKFGSAVFSTQFGQNVMRTKPSSVKNPRTPGQVNQRSKFKLMVALARQILAILHFSFKNMAIGMSAFNVFIKQNIKTAVTGVPGNYSIDYSALIIAKGSLYKSANCTGSAETLGKVKRMWTPPIDPADVSNFDLLYVASYNETKDEWFYGKTTTARSVGLDHQILPGSWVGDTVHVYTFFFNPTGTSVSNSTYCGQIVVI